MLSVAALAACTSNTPASQRSLAQAFAEIQVHEASIEHARAAASRPQASCAERCQAATSAADHAVRVCELARDAADADALTRCERARGTHGDVTAATRDARCTCVSILASAVR